MKSEICIKSILGHEITLCSIFAMTFRVIDRSVKELIIRLQWFFTDNEVAYYLGLHVTTIRRVANLYKETGDVVKEAEKPFGRPRILDWEEAMVRSSLVKVCLLFSTLTFETVHSSLIWQTTRPPPWGDATASLGQVSSRSLPPHHIKGAKARRSNT